MISSFSLISPPSAARNRRSAAAKSSCRCPRPPKSPPARRKRPEAHIAQDRALAKEFGQPRNMQVGHGLCRPLTSDRKHARRAEPPRQQPGGQHGHRCHRRREGGAAAKATVEVSAQIRVAKVCVPIGASSKVAVSSVVTEMNTIAAAAPSPGAANGKVTRSITASQPSPSERPASSSRICACSSAAARSPKPAAETGWHRQAAAKACFGRAGARHGRSARSAPAPRRFRARLAPDRRTLQQHDQPAIIASGEQP